MVANELLADDVTIADMTEDYILFGIGLESKPGRFLSEAVFADFLFGPGDTGSMDGVVSDSGIAARFIQNVENQIRYRGEIIQAANLCPETQETQSVIPLMPVVLESKLQPPALSSETEGIMEHGAISGYVSGPSGTELFNAEVRAYDSNGRSVGSTFTDEALGYYNLGNLAPDTYKIYFQSYSPSHASEFYNDKPVMKFADPVGVTGGNTTSGIDAQLELGGLITGLVSDASGIPLSGIRVYCYNKYQEMIMSVYTGTDGTYSIGWLREGTYKLRFYDYAGTYSVEWYDNKTNFCESNAISVTAGATTSGINAALAEAGSISGKVSASSGAGIESLWVYAYDADDYYNYDRRESARTDASGDYTITRLAPGSYKVRFSNYQNYMEEWYNNDSHYCGASELSVSQGQHRTGINATLDMGGSISGTVRDLAGNGYANCYVSVYDSDGSYVLNAYPDSNGHYAAQGLASGNYRLRASDRAGIYEPIYYINKQSLGEADEVSVTPGTDASGIDIQFTTEIGGGDGFTISGYVYDANDVPVSYCPVRLLDTTTGNFVKYDSSDYGTGAYQFTGVSAGSYKVYFEAYNSRQPNCISEWYNNKADKDTANTITITDSDVQNINATLDFGGTIQGWVKTPAGAALVSGNVAIEENSTGYQRSVSINCGVYVIQGLPAGSYNFQVTPYSQYYYYDSASVSPISVTVGQITEYNHTIESQPGGAITGRSTYYKDGKQVWPVSGNVYVYDESGSYTCNYYLNAYNCGRYNRNPSKYLQPAVYFVRFYNYADSTSAWYNRKESMAAADPVDVVSEQTTDGIDCIFGNPGTAALPGIFLFLLDE
ncbi:MAG: carboxypeptidase-like regulatory domain-containing protein [Desulfobacterales bacterium]|nr:carboxypeptidase-like regulatory domain-containing protein [Desulfobacterales bacterium]